ncbi:unnamed protein product [Closterium sp. NIES-54]
MRTTAAGVRHTTASLRIATQAGLAAMRLARMATPDAAPSRACTRTPRTQCTLPNRRECLARCAPALRSSHSRNRRIECRDRSTAACGGISRRAQGSSVVAALLASGRYRIRAVTRHADSPRAAHLRDAKVEVAQADQADRQAVRAALDGAYGAFVVTDYYSLGARELEVGKGVVEEAREAGVQHVVWSTLPHVHRLSKGRLNVPHFTNKAQVEEVVRASGFKQHTFVMCAFYYQNFAHFHLAREEADGTVVFELPMAPDDMLTAFDVDDTGAAVLNALDHPDEWDGEYMCLAGYHAPVHQYLADFHRVTGRAARLHTTDKAASEEWTQWILLRLVGLTVLHHMSCHVMSCHVMSCHVVSCRVVSCRVVSCRVVSCRVVSCRVVSCHVMSCLQHRSTLSCLLHSPSHPLSPRPVPPAQMFHWFAQHTYFGCHDISNARRCNPHLKTWRQWLQESGWKGPEGGEGKGEAKGEAKGEGKGEAEGMGGGKEVGGGAKEVEHGGEEAPPMAHVAGA